jgi:hypothetical protein
LHSSCCMAALGRGDVAGCGIRLGWVKEAPGEPAARASMMFCALHSVMFCAAAVENISPAAVVPAACGCGLEHAGRGIDVGCMQVLGRIV